MSKQVVMEKYVDKCLDDILIQEGYHDDYTELLGPIGGSLLAGAIIIFRIARYFSYKKDVKNEVKRAKAKIKKYKGIPPDVTTLDDVDEFLTIILKEKMEKVKTKCKDKADIKCYYLEYVKIYNELIIIAKSMIKRCSSPKIDTASCKKDWNKRISLYQKDLIKLKQNYNKQKRLDEYVPIKKRIVMKEDIYLQALKEAQERKVNFTQLIQNLKKFSKEQYLYCSKKIKTQSGNENSDQTKLQIKRVCNNAVGLALRKQKGMCKQLGGFFSEDKMKCQQLIDKMASEYWDKANKYDKKYKTKYKGK